MSKAQLVITAAVLEGRSKSDVARDYDLSRQWVHRLVTRYQTDGAAAFEPRSRRPHTNARAISAELEERIVRLRKTLDKAGYDAGPATIAEHLSRDAQVPKVPALSTIWRVLTRRGFITAQPHKRPRCAWKRFSADQPNELWQADVTHWQLANGTKVEILNILDDHSAWRSPAQPALPSPAPTSPTPSPPHSPHGAHRHRCSPTTGPSSPPHRGAAGAPPCRSSSVNSASNT
ncbi:MAG TPA: helix-turn-helix domain-containing protein [Mycobacterium sp.]|nr:helix-turn-helix domain-containing protein [Mycobacterium sp.]